MCWIAWYRLAKGLLALSSNHENETSNSSLFLSFFVKLLTKASPTCSIYSIALSKLTAPIKLGVQGSNLSGASSSVYHVLVTDSTAPPPAVAG